MILFYVLMAFPPIVAAEVKRLVARGFWGRLEEKVKKKSALFLARYLLLGICMVERSGFRCAGEGTVIILPSQGDSILRQRQERAGFGSVAVVVAVVVVVVITLVIIVVAIIDGVVVTVRCCCCFRCCSCRLFFFSFFFVVDGQKT